MTGDDRFEELHDRTLRLQSMFRPRLAVGCAMNRNDREANESWRRQPNPWRGVPLSVQFLGRSDYEWALGLQDELVKKKVSGDSTDYLLLLEHEAVFTLGRGASETDLCGADCRLGVPVFRINRGGGVTYHGPGQLVAYPIVRLPIPDVRAYIHFLGEVVVRTCLAFGANVWVDRERIGVWARGGKIASFGIGLRRWVAFHGLALNVQKKSVPPFEAIVPCRSPGLVFTSLEGELGRPLEVDSVAVCFADCFTEAWSLFCEQGRSKWKSSAATLLG